MNTAVVSAVMIYMLLKQSYSDKRKKLAQFVCKSVFQSVLHFSHIHTNASIGKTLKLFYCSIYSSFITCTRFVSRLNVCVNMRIRFMRLVNYIASYDE